MIKNKNRFLLVVFCSWLLALFPSCHITKRLHSGEHLLTNNIITYHFPKPEKTKGLNKITSTGKEGLEDIIVPDEIDKSHVIPYLKQKPNTRIFGLIPFKLYVYNIGDTAKSKIHKEKRNQKFTEKAERKHWSDEKLKKKLNRKTGREWIMAQGEPPVKFDSSLLASSAQQVRKFLFNKGYFNAKVTDSARLKGNRATAYYILQPGFPYIIRSLYYSFEDENLKAEILSDTIKSVLKKGQRYDKDNFDAERLRLTTELNNNGYYFFSTGYVNYLVDTNVKDHTLDVNIVIKKYVTLNPKNPNQKILSDHRYMQIRNVTIEMQHDPSNSSYHPEDTVVCQTVKFVAPKNQMGFRPVILRQKIYVVPFDVYRIENVERTYSGLSQLKAFRYISVKFTEVKDSNLLDCTVQLLPLTKQSVGGELDVTNTGGDKGIQGDFSYQNINLFRGAEQLQLKLNGGLIAQRLLTSNEGNINKYIPLNTIDIGPELDFQVPRPWLPPFSFFNYKSRWANPQMVIKLSYNYQQRVDYTRHVWSVSPTFDFNEMETHHYTISILEISGVNANLSPDFAELLKSYNLFIQNSFKNQFIADARLSYTGSNQTTAKGKNFTYFKFSLESSGICEQLMNPYLNRDVSGSYDIAGVPYSQYGKVDADFRYYHNFTQGEKIAFRILGGYGQPYNNALELPYSKSYWGGGSNDIRAWNFQTLGPGSSQNSSVLGQVGDIKIELNQEYRVSLIRYFGMAFFFDEGNIWLIKNSANLNLPLSYLNFQGPNGFLNEFAVGTGVGFRFDFTYFVFRIDLGQPVVDPSYEPGHKIIPLRLYTIRRTVINFGIGYPF